MKPEEIEPWGDLEGWQDLWEEGRSVYSMMDVRRDLRRPLGPGEPESWSDVVLFVSETLTGQVDDLSETRIWFLERLGIDYPTIDEADDHAPLPKSTASPALAEPTASKTPPTVAETKSRHFQCSMDQQKNTHMRQPLEKSRTSGTWKTRTSGSKKTRTEEDQWLCGVVVGGGGLEVLLRKHGQKEWASAVRMSGLLLLIDFIARKSSGKPIHVSGALARDYVSDFCHRKSKSTIRQPLEVLRRIGVIERVKRHLFGRYAKSAASYQLNPALVSRVPGYPVLLNPCNERKRRMAFARAERRLDSMFPYLGPLREVSAGVRLSRKGVDLALKMLMNSTDRKKTGSLKLIIGLTGGDRRAKIRVTSTGHITHSFACCPRDLKPHLLLDGSSVSLCDISHAHFCILPRLLLDEIEKARSTGVTEGDLAPLIAERLVLIQFLGDGDFYSKLSSDPDSDEEREWAKARLVKVLNWRNLWTTKDKTYQRLKELFPETMAVVEAIKRGDHKKIQAPLRNLTAQAINGALLQLQAQGIPAIPDTDSIICPSDKRDLVCRIIGEEVFRVTGVCCKVDQVRFEPTPARPRPAAIAATPPLLHA